MKVLLWVAIAFLLSFIASVLMGLFIEAGKGGDSDAPQ